MVEFHVAAEYVLPEGAVWTLAAGQPVLRPVGIGMSLPISPPLEVLATGWTHILDWMNFLSVDHQLFPVWIFDSTISTLGVLVRPGLPRHHLASVPVGMHVDFNQGREFHVALPTFPGI